MSTPPIFPRGAALALVLLLVLSGLTAATASASTPGSLARVSGSAGIAVIGGVEALADRSPAAPPCPSPPVAWNDLYGGLESPPAPDPAALGPCALGPDENSLSLLSNASEAGARATLVFNLPTAGSALGSVLTSLSVRLWVSGVPCAVDQAAQVEVQVIPPMSPFAAAPQLNWTVRAPAFDLVAPATCDPTCSNDTALVTFEGAAVCEDQIVVSAAGAPPLVPQGSFPPGSTVSITFVGSTAGSQGLSVYVNDSASPSGGLAFRYDAASVVTGRPLEPLFPSSNLSGSVWGLSPALSVVATHCPLAASPGAACTSYDASLWSGVRPVELVSALSWNSSSSDYDVPYDRIALVSSTGGCTTGPLECERGPGAGPGSFYPSWALHGAAGSTRWTYGAAYPGEVRSFPAVVGPSNGTQPRYTTPIAIGLPGTVVSPSTFNVTVHVTDPAGVARVSIAVDYCTISSSTAPTVTNATLDVGPADTALDGNWTAQFPVGSFHGSFPLWVEVFSSDAARLGGTTGSVTIPGGPTSCSFLPPSTPTPAVPFATPTALGYFVRWSESDPAVVGFTINASAPNGSVRLFDVGTVDEARIDLGAPNVSFNLSVAARDGANVTSAFTAPVLGGPTADPFSFQVALSPPSPIWLGGPPLNISGTVSGGVAPYAVEIAFGDGAADTIVANGTFSWLHDFGLFFGEARLRVTASDASGDRAVAGPYLEPVWATPLGSASSAIGGDGIVEIQWQVPPSPPGPVVGARVFYSTDAALAPLLARAGGSNGTVPGIVVWNITAITNNLFFVAVPNGLTLYAQVVARNSYGTGQLPAGPPAPLVARPAPLVLSPIVSVGGGGAPFTDNFSAQVTGGSNDSIASAFYSFPSGGTSGATVTYVNGTSYLNATHTFPSPGTFVVVLHATDALFETVIDTASVFVAPGAPPGLSALIVNGPAYAGGSVDFEATASGGSGNYSFNWSFGDGTTAAGTNAVHTFAVSGVYSVLVRVVDDVTGGTSAIVVPVTVYALPVIFVSVTPGPNGSLSYDLRASVGGGSGTSAVVWSFGDGTIARGATVSHDYRAAGIYPVNVTATDPAGRSGTESFNLSANPTPTGGGGNGGSTGITLLELILAGVAAFLLATTLYFGARARPPPEPPVEESDEGEDGEVSLT